MSVFTDVLIIVKVNKVIVMYFPINGKRRDGKGKTDENNAVFTEKILVMDICFGHSYITYSEVVLIELIDRKR